jgi:hypothetical protein
VSAQDTAHHILIDLDAESQNDLLGNARTAPMGIAPLHGHDGVNEFSVRSLRAGSTPALGRKQPAVLSFPQQVVQMQQGGGLQNDGGTEDACRPHQEGEQTGDEAIGGAQVGRTLASTIEDEQLMPEQRGLGNHGTEGSVAKSAESVLLGEKSMPITLNNAFKGRQHPGELIILCVRLYLRYPLSYEHVAELVAERGVEADASCIWR